MKITSPALTLIGLLVSMSAFSTPPPPTDLEKRQELLKVHCDPNDEKERAISALDKVLDRVARLKPQQDRALTLHQLASLPAEASSAQIAEALKISNSEGDRVATLLTPEAHVSRVSESLSGGNGPCVEMFFKRLKHPPLQIPYLKTLRSFIPQQGEMMMLPQAEMKTQPRERSPEELEQIKKDFNALLDDQRRGAKMVPGQTYSNDVDPEGVK